MAFVSFQGRFPWDLPAFAMAPTINTSIGLIDATGEKYAWMGYPQTKDVGKSLVGVGFRFGTITKAGGSALIVSHQDVSLTTGPPEQPTEVIVGQVAIANADAAFVTNAWINTAAFDVARTVTAAPFAIVVEYDVAGRLGADSVVLGAINTINTSYKNLVGAPALKTATWAAADSIQDIVFIFGDGTFGSFVDAYPTTLINASAFNTGTVPDERAMEFTVPFSVKVDGAWFVAFLAASADLDVVLYDGSTAMVTVSIDANAILSNGARPVRISFPEQQLDAGHTYRLALKPSTVNNVTAYDFTANIAGHLQAWPGGEAFYLTTRTDAGAWNAILNRRPLMGLYLSAVDIPAGGGGGGGGSNLWMNG